VTSIRLCGLRQLVISGAAASLILTAPGQSTTMHRVSETGRIEGVATIAPVLKVVHARIRLYDEPGTPPPRRPSGNPIDNVVIYLDGGPSLRGITSPMTHPAAALHQRDETFVPHVLTIVSGTTVRFPNDDPLFHDVFSLSSTKSFDLQRYPQGATRQVQFAKPGVVEVYCHIHADMSAYIVVVDNTFFVTPDTSGHFVLDGVPPGDYRLIAWYERSRPVITNVHVDAGQTRHQDIRIPIPAS
jgi:plastocyanin